MFRYGHSLTSLNLSNFQTPKLLKMTFMLQECSSLKYLDISNMNTSSINNINGTFSNFWELISLNLSNFDTKNFLLWEIYL